MKRNADKSTVTPDQIGAAVMAHYLSTGEHIFVSELAKKLGTSAKKISEAWVGGGFEYIEADRETGPWYARRTVSAFAVVPTKAALRRMILVMQEAE